MVSAAPFPTTLLRLSGALARDARAEAY